jgi:hypothetical protein
VDAFLAGEDETAVEGLVDSTEDEVLTPMPDESSGEVAEPPSEWTPSTPKQTRSSQRGKQAASVNETPASSKQEQETKGVISEADDAEGEADEGPYPPGTLGTCISISDCLFELTTSLGQTYAMLLGDVLL